MANDNATKRRKTRLIWTDLEMSGLSPKRDVILEAAFIITDGDFNTIAESDSWAVSQPDSVLNHMDKWNTETHTKSGLIERCRQATMNVGKCEQAIIKFLKKHAEAGRSPMCGNSICVKIGVFWPVICRKWRNFFIIVILMSAHSKSPLSCFTLIW